MLTLLIFIAVLAVLVLAHEFGHFITARIFGMKVEEFGFGFPPRAIGIHRVTTGFGKKWRLVWGNKRVQSEVAEATHAPGTVYSINWLPLGGFVKIKGEDSVSDGANDPDSFNVKKWWQKAIVLLAGVIMNVLVSVLLLSIAYSLGVRQPVPSGTAAQNITFEVMSVVPEYPAAKAGITVGDSIVRVGGVRVGSIEEFQAYLQAHKNESVALDVERDGKITSFNLKPAVYPDTGKVGVGVGLAEVGLVHYPWYSAIYHGFLDTWYYIQAIFLGLGTLIKGLFTGGGAGSVSGPVGVAVMTGKAARMGITYLLQFMAVLSVNLAVLNVLPVPALDGGRLLFVLIGAVLRRPVTPKLEQMIHTIGFIVLLLLVLLITVKDVGGLWHRIA